MLIKLRFRFPEIFFGMLLAVAIFVIGAMFGSSHQSPNGEQAPQGQQKTADKNDTNNRKAQSLWVPVDSIGLYTLLLTAFTSVLAGASIFQGVMQIRADKSTRLAAEAADLNARAAIAIELPIIKMSLSDLSKGSTLKKGEDQTEHLSVLFVTFTNLGRTKAFPVKLRYGFAVGKLPDKPQYPFVDTFQYDDIFDALPPKEFKKYLVESYVIATGVWDDIASGKLPVWFFCELVYLDFMQDRERDAAYCWRLQKLGIDPGWRPEDNPAYNH